VRIALTCPYAWDDAGGVQVHIAELARRLQERAHDVLVLTPARQPVSEGWVHVVGSPVDLPYNASNAPIDPRPWSRGRVHRELETFEPDLIHAHEPLTPSTSMWATVGSGETPVVATFHSAAARSRLFDLSAPVLRRIAPRLAVRVAVSEAAAAFARKRIGGRFEIVPNGVDLARFSSSEPADLGDGTKLLFVGRLDQRKGFRVAVQAFARAASTRPGLRLVVVGDGPDREVLGRLAPSLREAIRMVGTVDNFDVASYYEACDVYLGPAVGGESFGIVLVEAMAAGIPVVASDIPGYDEVVTDGQDGLLVPPNDPAALADAAGRVLDDPALASKLVAGGRERAAHFDWGSVTDRLEDIYRRTVPSPPA
jgi:phosphatidyl-myo-inositol alpha-mannosyltransferase